MSLRIIRSLAAALAIVAIAFVASPAKAQTQVGDAYIRTAVP